MSELLRDYLQFNNSFLDGNMASLKKLTSPLKDSEYEEVTDPKKIEEAKLSKKLYIGTNKDNEGKYFIIRKNALGSGKINKIEQESINKSVEYKLKDLESFQAYKYIENYENNLTIYIPKAFNSYYMSEFFKDHKINLKCSKRNELPQIVQDFVRCLDIKNIKSPQDISQKIKFFNYNIVKRLDDLFFHKKLIKPKNKINLDHL